MNERELIVGIDLGTTNSVISHWDEIHGEPLVYQVEFSSCIFPSVVGYNSMLDQWLYGMQAKNRLIAYPEETVANIKRYMGTDHVTPIMDGKAWKPVEISSMILKQLAEKAESFVPDSHIVHVVVSHPYDFTNQAKKDTKAAAMMAFEDLPEDRILLVEEPTAAALAFGLDTILRDGEIVFVFDLGGGTFDITIFQAHVDGDVLNLEVLALGGDKNLGGNNFDERLVEQFKEWFKEIGVDVDAQAESKKFIQKLMEVAEDTKKFLSATPRNSLTITNPVDLFGMPVSKIIKREEFEGLCSDLFEKIKKSIETTVNAARRRRDFDHFDHILLVGGSTEMPKIREIVECIFKKEPDVARDRAFIVSRGATFYSALKAGVLKGRPIRGLPYRDITVENLLPHTIGIQAQLAGNDIFWRIFPKGHKKPTGRKDFTFTLSGELEEEDLIVFESSRKEPIGTVLIEDFVKIYGEEIGRSTFSVTTGKKREIKITFEVDENGYLKGTFSDPGGEETPFEIDMFKSYREGV